MGSDMGNPRTAKLDEIERELHRVEDIADTLADEVDAKRAAFEDALRELRVAQRSSERAWDRFSELVCKRDEERRNIEIIRRTVAADEAERASRVDRKLSSLLGFDSE